VLHPFRLAVLLAFTAVLVGADAGTAKEPPNQNDPCSSGGRNTCDTVGVGFYDTYAYGVRWFGDYRNAVPDARQTFCIDLQYWYPSSSYRFRELAGEALRNREGEVVPIEHRRRMAYAMWAYGRSNRPNQQAAVMLYVHGQMGDARPGEADPAAVSDPVAQLYERVAKDAGRYHGPYRVEVGAPGKLRVGENGTATIRVLSHSGVPLPDVELTLSAEGTSVPTHVSTGSDGVASVEFTARTADGATITARTEPISSTLPVVYAPTTPSAGVNGQRLAAPSSQVVSGSSQTDAFKGQAHVSSTADPATVVLGEASTDRVTITGVDASFDVVATSSLYGPARSTGAIRCDGTPARETEWRTNGPGDYVTKAVTPPRPGWYVYRQVVPDSAGYEGAKTTCTDPAERVKVVAQPVVHTQVSSSRVAPGASITDTVTVEGLGGEKATVQAVLYGPFPARGAISCSGTPVWQGTIEADGDGEYRTGAFKAAAPGYYSYRERLVGSEFVRATETPCLDAAETTVVVAQPKASTQVSDAKVGSGAQLTDTVTVSGAGSVELTVNVALYGPFATSGGISCSGQPVWTGTIAASGNGTYTTAPATVEKVGYYTYRESIARTEQTDAFVGECGASSETSLVTAAPRVVTTVSDDVVSPGDAIHDEISVSGLGSSEARIGVQLYGPFATRAAIKCTGTPYDTAEVYAHGDGVVTTPGVRLKEAGFYTYVERLVGTDLIAEATTVCGEVSETALARPLVITGRNDATGRQSWAAADPPTPVRVRIEGLGIDAPVSPAGIDLKAGVLDVPAPISRLGWWLDGRLPGSKSGAVLIAGHVDSATAGAGALFHLKDARPGDRIQVTSTNGRTFGYRVTSVKTMPKQDLPPSIYSRSGPARLVLVTCGGPFDAGSRHYRDNVVVTAVPA
jgi:sortase family protein